MSLAQIAVKNKRVNTRKKEGKKNNTMYLQYTNDARQCMFRCGGQRRRRRARVTARFIRRSTTTTATDLPIINLTNKFMS